MGGDLVVESVEQETSLHSTHDVRLQITGGGDDDTESRPLIEQQNSTEVGAKLQDHRNFLVTADGLVSADGITKYDSLENSGPVDSPRRRTQLERVEETLSRLRERERKSPSRPFNRLNGSEDHSGHQKITVLVIKFTALVSGSF